jgi:hypothetical protein
MKTKQRDPSRIKNLLEKIRSWLRQSRILIAWIIVLIGIMLVQFLFAKYLVQQLVTSDMDERWFAQTKTIVFTNTQNISDTLQLQLTYPERIRAEPADFRGRPISARMLPSANTVFTLSLKSISNIQIVDAQGYAVPPQIVISPSQLSEGTVYLRQPALMLQSNDSIENLILELLSDENIYLPSKSSEVRIGIEGTINSSMRLGWLRWIEFFLSQGLTIVSIVIAVIALGIQSRNEKKNEQLRQLERELERINQKLPEDIIALSKLYEFYEKSFSYTSLIQRIKEEIKSKISKDDFVERCLRYIADSTSLNTDAKIKEFVDHYVFLHKISETNLPQIKLLEDISVVFDDQSTKENTQNKSPEIFDEVKKAFDSNCSIPNRIIAQAITWSYQNGDEELKTKIEDWLSNTPTSRQLTHYPKIRSFYSQEPNQPEYDFPSLTPSLQVLNWQSENNVQFDEAKLKAINLEYNPFDLNKIPVDLVKQKDWFIGFPDHPNFNITIFYTEDRNDLIIAARAHHWDLLQVQRNFIAWCFLPHESSSLDIELLGYAVGETWLKLILIDDKAFECLTNVERIELAHFLVWCANSKGGLKNWLEKICDNKSRSELIYKRITRVFDDSGSSTHRSREQVIEWMTGLIPFGTSQVHIIALSRVLKYPRQYKITLSQIERLNSCIDAVNLKLNLFVYSESLSDEIKKCGECLKLEWKEDELETALNKLTVLASADNVKTFDAIKGVFPQYQLEECKKKLLGDSKGSANAALIKASKALNNSLG